jgi:hypothetical protein
MVRSRVLAWQLRLTALVGVAGGVVAGCGDPVLPSDYAGPPASTTTGKVVALGTVTAKEVSRPRLSLEWLTSLSGAQGQSALEGQPLRFSRSPTLQTDWDIGLEVPISSSSLIDQGDTGTDGLQISVGKMVYYDDRNADGRLDWTCRAGACDVAQAVSEEYVVYVGGTKACRNSTGGLETGARPAAGYSYYQFRGGAIRKLKSNEPVSFLLADLPLAARDPSDELRRFASLLLTLWQSLGALSGGC